MSVGKEKDTSSMGQATMVSVSNRIMISIYGWHCLTCGFKLGLSSDAPLDVSLDKLNAYVTALLNCTSDFSCPLCDSRQLQVLGSAQKQWSIVLTIEEALNALSGLGLPEERKVTTKAVLDFFQAQGIDVDLALTDCGNVVLRSVSKVVPVEAAHTTYTEILQFASSGSGAVVAKRKVKDGKGSEV